MRILPRLAALSAAVAALAGMAGAQVALPDPVESTPLATDVFSTGMLQRSQGALPPTLWTGSDADTLAFLLDNAPARPAQPSLGRALRRILLSPGPGPEGAPATLGGKKLLALARAGFGEEARTIASLSNADRNGPWVARALALADLLHGETSAACRRGANLSAGRDEIFWVKLRVFCYAQAGERDAADLTLAILRDRGALDETDAALLAAATTGMAPKSSPLPRNALHFAIYKSLGAPLTPALLSEADAGVLKAVASDAAFDIATRIAAAEQASAAGAMDGAALAALFQSFTLDVADVGRAADIAAARPGDPLTDALLYQAISEMNAPEFLRDKAIRIAQALGVADSFARAYALAILYADEVNALEGALLSSDEAGRFALARMAVGDGAGAGRWLFAMKDAEDLGAMAEADAMAFIELVNLLAVLDPASAAIVADSAGVMIAETPAGGLAPSVAAPEDDPALAGVVEAAFDAALDGETGQAALAALAASPPQAAGDGGVRDVVVMQSLRAAGLEDVRRRLAFELAWAARAPTQTPPPAAPAPEAAAAEEEGGLMPRLKPPRKKS
ncbi:MAG: hypothetical protein ACE5FO_06550 [Parvularculaceae bacterium]